MDWILAGLDIKSREDWRMNRPEEMKQGLSNIVDIELYRPPAHLTLGPIWQTIRHVDLNIHNHMCLPPVFTMA